MECGNFIHSEYQYEHCSIHLKKYTIVSFQATNFKHNGAVKLCDILVISSLD